MFLKKYKPITSSLRARVLLDKKNFNRFSFKFLRLNLINKSGRNSTGSITIRHQGGGSFSFYKSVDFFRFYSSDCSLVDISFDKRRTGLMGLFSHNIGGFSSFRYLLLPDSVELGKSVRTSFVYRGSNDSVGDTLPIGWIPNTKIVYNVEIKPGFGGLLARSAGSFCKIMRQTRRFTEIKIPSGKILKISPYCFATLGRVSNINHRFEHYSYAGYFRHLGKRPSVRGEAMNAVDHPHGGKTRGGRPPMTPWGKIIK